MTQASSWGAILARPDEHAGKALAGATRCYTMTEMAEIMARSSGRKITYTQVPKDAFAGFLLEASRPTLLNMLSYFEEFGYYGPDTEQLVKEAATSCEGGPGWIWGVPGSHCSSEGPDVPFSGLYQCGTLSVKQL